MSNTSPNAPLAAVSAVLDGYAVAASVPLGASLRFFDGSPRPPERFRRKLSSWKNRNDTGRLVQKTAACTLGGAPFPANFTLHLGDFGANGVIVMIVNRGFQVSTDLRFEVLELPAPGMVRVLTRHGDREELRHLAPDMAAAEQWMSRNRYSNMIAEIVGDEGNGVAPVGRAA
ncbi:hypothetical protein [Sphingobium sp. YR768]|uniref:hypothetical protein n=1 Tax=Sphingobium sp. YR768 TaxID=1884365 RepID=UPI0008D3B600|nr:hypothetical protein [Sphingobium sp. YR768]SER00515.1 hypothetical protein SAMN05518866_10477 [Sphingobium sp. YR768]